MQRAAIDIIRMMPAHRHYVEPFGGWIPVLLRKPLGASEVVNDTLTHLTTFYKVLRDDGAALIQRLTATQYSEPVLKEAQQRIGRESDLITAWAMFVILRQSYRGLCRTIELTKFNKSFMNDNAAAWLHAVDRLPQILRRLRGVVILNRDACQVIPENDGKHTLFYCDPPYPSVRGMRAERHQSFVALLKRIKGSAIVEGIDHPIYTHAFRDWNRVEFKTLNAASRTPGKEIHVWTNF